MLLKPWSPPVNTKYQSTEDARSGATRKRRNQGLPGCWVVVLKASHNLPGNILMAVENHLEAVNPTCPVGGPANDWQISSLVPQQWKGNCSRR